MRRFAVAEGVFRLAHLFIFLGFIVQIANLLDKSLGKSNELARE